MLPKKQPEVQRQPILGRIGTDVKMGILGMPNVGKSTFFNVLKKSEAQDALGTSDPNESKVAVKDSIFDWLVELYKPLSRVPAYLTVAKIAGLVKGASEGQGLGNAVLSHVGACDALFHLCRSFEDTEVTHVEGDVDPIRDLEIINSELRLKDQADLLGALDKSEKLVANDTTKKLEYDTLLKVKELLETKFVRQHDWNEKEVEVLNKHLFLTAKPIVYLVNLSEQDFIKKENKWLPKIKSWIDENDPGSTLIPFSGAFELKSVEMDSETRAQYFKETGASSALDKIIQTGYKTLCFEHYFESSTKEVRAIIYRKGAKVPQGAGRIYSHSDEGFIP